VVKSITQQVIVGAGVEPIKRTVGDTFLALDADLLVTSNGVFLTLSAATLLYSFAVDLLLIQNANRLILIPDTFVVYRGEQNRQSCKSF
jgi:hypothetical protein